MISSRFREAHRLGFEFVFHSKINLLASLNLLEKSLSTFADQLGESDGTDDVLDAVVGLLRFG